MDQPRDYYEVLGIGRGSSADEIRRAHRKLARQYHPDVNKSPEAVKRFNEIQSAYDVLSDEQKRKAYDQFGHAGVSGGAAGDPFGAAGRAGASRGGTRTWTTTTGPGGRTMEPEEFSTIFEEFFGGGGGGSPFGQAGAGRARQASRAGDDVQYELTIPFMTAALGGTHALRLSKEEGVESIDVKIPPGIHDGATLRVRGKGQPGLGAGAPSGDLLLKISVAPHPFFRRDGLDVLADIPITIAEAASGASVTAPLLKGTVQIKVPPGTSSGRKLRVKGKGVADAKGNTGDYYAVIQIVAPGPDELNDADKRALEQMTPRLGHPREGGPIADALRAADSS